MRVTLRFALALAAALLICGASSPSLAETASEQPLFLGDACKALTGSAGEEPLFAQSLGSCDCVTDSDCDRVCFDGGVCFDGQCKATSSGGCDCTSGGGGDDGGSEDGCVGDDCQGGCSITCTTNSHCESQCPFGVGFCASGECVCAC